MADEQTSNLPNGIPVQPEAAPNDMGDATAGRMFAAHGSSAAGEWQAPTPEELQPRFSQYEIRGILGKGGMGAVYKAWHKNLQRLVAIKILPADIEDGGMNFAERFRLEAMAMAKFQHPAIVSVYDSGETPDGILYFVMECIEGTDVARLVAENGALPPSRAVAITCRVCEALIYAHERGVIHRDIKPSNIMIDRDGAVKVADFGLAKFPMGDRHVTTGSGLSVGTVDFMPPEALQGSGHADHRADIYAVGGLLYQMLTGKAPHGRFEPPSVVVPGLDSHFDRIVEKAMQADPDKRYAKAAELLADLTQIDAGESSAATVGRQVTTSPARRPASRVVLAGLLITVILAVAAVAIGSRKKRNKTTPDGDNTQPSVQSPAEAPTPPAPAVVSAAWRDAFAESPLKDVVAKAERTAQGYLLPENNHWPISPEPCRSGALRVRATSESGNFINLFVGHGERQGERVRFHSLTKRWLLSQGEMGTRETDFAARADTSPMDGRPHELLLARIGGRIRTMLDGHLLHDEPDPSQDRGRFTLDVYRGAQARVEKVEYLDLEGVSEGEALKLIGLDSGRPALAVAKIPALAGPASATKEAPFINALGMKFVPVPITGGPTDGKRVLFSIWETRVQDYDVFAKETNREWLKPEFEQAPTHPAVRVTWDDAQAFCAWLTERERKAGRLGAAERFRLPTDHEWSCAVGIGDREDPAIGPAEKSGKILVVFPWCDTWPPPPGAGNYSGEEAEGNEFLPTQIVIKGYRDDFITTAPAGSFSANQFGLFDLGGNAWEWCEDRWKEGEPERVIRGASHRISARAALLSSKRGFSAPEKTNTAYGFRVVLDLSASTSGQGKAATPTASSGISNSAEVKPPGDPQGALADATRDNPFVNSLGMKFVPVPITGGPTDGKRVLFSIWETRVQDYEVFVKETQREFQKPRFEQGPTHPVVKVSWEDATAFCGWLTERERTGGRLGAAERYRLPTDHEWSCAVGIGDREYPAIGPARNAHKLTDAFPWGTAWPPPPGAGNYSGEEAAGHEMAPDQKILAGYRDDFPHTAPVGSFAPNALGLFDLGGNAWEWCEDQWKPGEPSRVIRGGSFGSARRDGLLSSYRDFNPPEARNSSFGFRVVIAAVDDGAGKK